MLSTGLFSMLHPVQEAGWHHVRGGGLGRWNDWGMGSQVGREALEPGLGVGMTDVQVR